MLEASLLVFGLLSIKSTSPIVGDNASCLLPALTLDISLVNNSINSCSISVVGLLSFDFGVVADIDVSSNVFKMSISNAKRIVGARASNIRFRFIANLAQ